MSEYIEFAVRVPKDEADLFISRFGKGNVKILGYLLREEIVRCRDCKYYKDRNGAILPSMVCQRLGYHNFKVEPDGFCAWGDRKEVARDDGLYNE